MEKVSIIIGLYNVTSFLEEKKLSCIRNQTYRNVEIILVNDGSTDQTLEAAKKIASLDDRVIIIDKKNGGPGSARNAGLNIATGKYVWFGDADDEAELTLIENNVRWMEAYQTDMNIFSYRCTTPHLNTVDEVKFRERIISSNSMLKSIFVDELLMVPNGNGFVWNKFYRKSFIDKHSFRFSELRLQQDEEFNLQLYPKIERVYVSSEQLYHYYVYNKGNVASRYVKDRFMIYTTIFHKFQEFFKEWNLMSERLEAYCYRRLYNGITTTILFNIFHKDSPLSLSEKRCEIHKVLTNDLARECIDYMQTHNSFGFESKLYLKAFAADSFFMICCLRMFYNNIRAIYRVIR